MLEQQQLGVVVAGCCWLRVAAMLEPRSGQTVVIADLCPACELVVVGGGGRQCIPGRQHDHDDDGRHGTAWQATSCELYPVLLLVVTRLN